VRILYIEDEPTDAQLVDRYIQSTSHDLVIVNNTQAAKAALEEEENVPDLLMVDVLIGHSREGYNFVRELRSKGYAQPIVAVTGLTTPYDLEQCHQSGFNEVLGKPYTIQQLAEMIERHA
jgi:CheY-like chemotaxis protein